MKHVITVIAMCLFSTSIFAFDGSKLRINVGGSVKGNDYLCVSQVGCINIQQGRSKALPLTPGQVSYIFLANGSNFRMFPQPLPSSCNVNVNDNQTLVVSGSVGNNKINQLRCSVV